MVKVQAFFKPSDVVPLTTQRQEHLNVGDQLGISPVRQRRNQAFSWRKRIARHMHSDLVACLSLVCHAKALSWSGDV
jgi:hypothetical protein